MLSITCTSPRRFNRRMYCTMMIIIKMDRTDISSRHSQTIIGTTCHLSSRLKTQTAMHTFPRHGRGPTERLATRNSPQQPSTISKTQDIATATDSETILIRLSRRSRNHKPPKHQIRSNQIATPVLIAIRPLVIPSSHQATSQFKRDKARGLKVVSY